MTIPTSTSLAPLAVVSATPGAPGVAPAGAKRRRRLGSGVERLRAVLALVRRAAAGARAFGPGEGFEIRPLLGIVAAFWAVVVGVDFINDWLLAGFAGDIRPVSRVGIDMLVWWGVWIAFVPALLILAARLDPERIGLRRSAAIHLALSLAVGLVHFVIVAYLFEAFGPSAETPVTRLGRFIAVFTLSQALTYWGFVGVVYAGHLWRRGRVASVRTAALERKADRLERASSETRLRALRRELETHFLLNSLNTLARLVREGRPDGTLRMVRGMGDLVRSGADEGSDVEVTLERELALLDRYLALVDAGHDARRRVRVRVDPSLASARVPPLLLQPLVENALVHGRGAVEVRGRRAGDELRLEVWNEVAPGTYGPRHDREGTGLATTRARLALLHGGAARLRVTTGGGGVRAVVELPLVAE